MTALETLDAIIADYVVDLENANSRIGLHTLLIEGCALARGYYLAGATSECEYKAACRHLRNVQQARVAALDFVVQARVEGLA